jgi:hypothetical protein
LGVIAEAASASKTAEAEKLSNQRENRAVEGERAVKTRTFPLARR